MADRRRPSMPADRGPRPAHAPLGARLVLRPPPGPRDGLGAGGRRRQLRPAPGRGARASSASRARARRRSGARCSAWSRRAPARSASRARRSPGSATPTARAAPPAADRLPGPARVAQPGDDDRRLRSPTRCASTSSSPSARGAARAGSAAALERVGLAPAAEFLDKYPADLSGGQKQRAVLARAIILDPDVLVADEPVSMLDMSVRAKILELMLELKDELDLTYVYITHDLATAKFFCDRIAIMYLGRIVELGPAAEIYADPKHPYTASLLRAIPEPDPTRSVPRDLPARRGPRRRLAAARAARSTRAARRRSRSAAGRAATCGRSSRSAGRSSPKRSSRASARSSTSPRSTRRTGRRGCRPDRATPEATSPRSCSGSVADAPDDPFWRGVRDVRADDTAAAVSFHEPLVPRPIVVGDSARGMPSP